MQIKQDSKLNKFEAFSLNTEATLQLKGGNVSQPQGEAAIIIDWTV